MLNKIKRAPGLLVRLLRGEISFGKLAGLDKRLHNYILSVSLREPPILQQLRAETSAMPMAGMQIAPEQGQFMALLARTSGAKKILEVGVFTGYSSLVLALGLPSDGKIIACDVSEEYTNIAQRYWQKAGVADKIDLRLAPALETMDQLIATGHAGSFDFIFIDADKENHPAYYEKALQLVRSGGLILIDNALWFGKVANPSVQDSATQAIRSLNKTLHHDHRITNLSLLPVGDGLVLATK